MKQGDPEAIAKIITASIATKGLIVAADSPEGLRRAGEALGSYIALIANTSRQDQQIAMDYKLSDGTPLMPSYIDLLNAYCRTVNAVLEQNWLRQAI